MKYHIHLVSYASTSVEVEADCHTDAINLALEKAPSADTLAGAEYGLSGEWEPSSCTDELGREYLQLKELQ